MPLSEYTFFDWLLVSVYASLILLCLTEVAYTIKNWRNKD